jgi:hypothetical protein
MESLATWLKLTQHTKLAWAFLQHHFNIPCVVKCIWICHAMPVKTLCHWFIQSKQKKQTASSLTHRNKQTTKKQQIGDNWGRNMDRLGFDPGSKLQWNRLWVNMNGFKYLPIAKQKELWRSQLVPTSSPWTLVFNPLNIWKVTCCSPGSLQLT